MPVSTSRHAHRALDLGELSAEAREESRETARPRKPRAGTECRGRANRPRAGPRPSPPSPRTPPRRGSPPGSARCTASSRTRRQAPSHRRPTARPACGIRAASARISRPIGASPRKCRPMTMIDDAGDNRQLARTGAQQRADRRSRSAPSATNTVEKPSTNSSARRSSRRAASGRGSRVGHRSSDRPGQIDEIGRHQRQHAGRQEADDAGDQRGEDGDVGRSMRARCDVSGAPRCASRDARHPLRARM